MFSEKTQIRIKIKLLKHKIKQIELANILGISRQQLNNVICGRVENLKLEEQILAFIKTLR